MFAVIRVNRDGSETPLRTCRTKEAALIASQMEKEKVSYDSLRASLRSVARLHGACGRSPAERGKIRAVAMDDEGFTEIRF